MKRIILFIMTTTLFLLSDNNITLNLFETIAQNNEDSNTDDLTAEYNSRIKDTLILGGEINVNLPNHFVVVKIKRINQISGERYSYTAKSEDNQTILQFAQVNSQILGTINIDNSSYRFSSTFDNKLIITENNFNTFHDHDDNYMDEIDSNLSLTSDEIATRGSLSNDTIITYTVIVAYTNEFSKDMSYSNDKIQAYMDTLEEETNQGYINSDIRLRVKIVHFYKTSYIDSGDLLIDKQNFMNTDKDYSKKIRTLRDQYYADIMILLVGNKGYSYCGVANIYANADTAFGAIKNECGIGYYSFGHEIGHIFGTRHIFYRDQQDTPYGFGHGYCSPDATWRTIMAYNCQNHAKPRILQWSNPNISIGGLPTGTEDLEFAAKVHNIRAKIVSDFRIPTPSPKLHEVAWIIPAIYYPVILAN
jgi:hypothetical protein